MMMFTSFISHDNNNGVRSSSLRVEDSDRDEILREHRQLFKGVTLKKMDFMDELGSEQKIKKWFDLI